MSPTDRKSTRLNSSHANISYAVFCLKKKKFRAGPDVLFFNDAATTEIYTLSLHDALPIWRRPLMEAWGEWCSLPVDVADRSEEHTSELQSRQYLVCRLLLEKKKISSRTRRFVF